VKEKLIWQMLEHQLIFLREMGGLVGSNPDISQKYKMGDVSKGVANTL
jgi:hypothetical protein